MLLLRSEAVMSEEFLKICPCCGREFNFTQWVALPVDGHMYFEDPPYRIQLRTCSCGSTMGIETDRNGRLCDQNGDHIFGGPVCR